MVGLELRIDSIEQDNEFPVFKWPPPSPDLNPTEHLWDVMEQEISTNPLSPH